MPSFQVTTPNARVSLRTDGTLEVPYSVTNVSNGPRRAALSIKASELQTQKWYSIRGTPSLEFSPGTTQQVTVVAAPANGAAPKEYSFSLIAALAENPDVDFTEGPAVTYEIPGRTPFPWWWIVIAALVIVAILVVVLWAIRKPGSVSVEASPSPVPTIPNLVGQTLSAAQGANANLTITDGNCPVYGPPSTAGEIATQSVAVGTPETVNQAVTVCLNAQGTQVPQLTGGSSATSLIQAVGLVAVPPNVSVFCGFGRVWGIVSLSPPSGTWVQPGSSVREVGACILQRYIIEHPPLQLHT